MTQNEIIEMARQAGIEEAYSLEHNQYLVKFKDGSLDAFAKLVAQHEREACAKVCEDSVEYAGDTLAKAIRARGEKA
jgi:hypothetical protein